MNLITSISKFLNTFYKFNLNSFVISVSKSQLVSLQELARNDLRERAIIEALYATGVRISELIQIRLEDIKWESRQIWIRKGKGNKERFVLFSYTLEEIMDI